MKIITSSIIALCCATAALASDYTTDSTQGSTTGQGGYYGFTFSLEASYLSSTIENVGEDLDAFIAKSIVALDQITLQTDKVSLSSMPYAIDKTFVSSYIVLINAAGETVASSTSTSTTEDGINYATISFNFTDSNLVIGEEYTVKFYETVAEVETALRLQILVTQDNCTTDNWVLLDSSYATISETYTPIVSIGTSQIPEPTTATLSLVALAGLMLRRRRLA